jgi:ABC-type sugar transport system ATPase subunit
MAQTQGLGNVHVGVRPEDVAVSRREGRDSIRGTLAGKVSLPMINASILRIHVAEHEIYAETADEEDLRAGDRVWLTFKQYHLFDKESGMRLRSFPET